MDETGKLNNLPLEALHQDAGARFCAFAGWSMPLTYPAGVMKEHLHCRAQAGLFDISHMKLFRITGREAAALLSCTCPFDAEALGQSRSKYTFFLDEDAGILDDLIVTRLGGTHFMVVANAGNAEADAAHLRAIAADFDCMVEPLDRVFLALQGPDAEDVISKGGLDLSRLAFMQGTEPRQGWFASRSGYTGEDGFEIALPVGEAQGFAEKLLQDDRVMWIGLAARDSLRLEAGLCLHGQDITTATNPVEAGLMWAIPKNIRESGDFIGAAALRDANAAGAGRKRVGLQPQGRQPVRAGTVLFDPGGAEIGRVTSGGFGPSAGAPVAMGYVDRQTLEAATPLLAEVRGARIAMTICPLPFIPHRYRKG